MLQYLVILLDDTSVSFCHHGNNKTVRRRMPLDTLRRAIRFGMVENLMIQFVYPDYDLPNEYREVINTIDHSDIVPATLGRTDADVVVYDGWGHDVQGDVAVVRTTLADLLAHAEEVKRWLGMVARLNIVVTDVEHFGEEQIEPYRKFLAEVGDAVERLYVNGRSPQLNLLTDSLMLTAMNNCGAGDTCVTLAPNGRFYVCPAFYHDDEAGSIGDLEHGLDIKNRQLYKLDYAPICRRCDAWQCRRCVWLNRKLTLEVTSSA